MPKLEVIEGSENYTCTVVAIQNLDTIPGMDNVVKSYILGNLVVVSKDTAIGDLGIFFASDTKISDEFLKKNNLYKSANLNQDPTKKGYFSDSGRVKALKLAKGTVISTGFWCPLSLLDFANTKGLRDGDEFNKLNDILICEKYLVHYQKHKSGSSGFQAYLAKNPSMQTKVDIRCSPEHVNSSHLAKSLNLLDLDDFVEISAKAEGTSMRTFNNPVRRKLSWFEHQIRRFNAKWPKLAQFLGMTVIINNYEYRYIAASRRVIKSLDFQTDEIPVKKVPWENLSISAKKQKVRQFLGLGNGEVNDQYREIFDIENADTLLYSESFMEEKLTGFTDWYLENNTSGFHSKDLYTEASKIFKDKLPKGMAVFSEIIGYDGEKPIMPDYGYGLPVGKFEVLVYRIAMVNPDGYIQDLPLPIKLQLCEQWQVKHVPVLYYGRVRDFNGIGVIANLDKDYNNEDSGFGWRQTFLIDIQDKFLDKPSIIGRNGFNEVEEGVVIHKERLGVFQYLKIKSPQYLLKNSKNLDDGKVGLEDMEGIIEENNNGE